MIPAAFAYARPSTIDEALQAIADGGDDVKILAGGQSLIPVMRLRMAAPELVVDLTRCEGLRGVREDGDHLVVGAMTTHADVLSDPLLAEYGQLLVQATETVADRQVRRRGTFGGALAHADPAGDLPAVALALDALRHLGVSDIRMPLTPERVWRAVHSGGDGGDRAAAVSNAQGLSSAEAATASMTEGDLR